MLLTAWLNFEAQGQSNLCLAGLPASDNAASSCSCSSLYSTATITILKVLQMMLTGRADARPASGW